MTLTRADVEFQRAAIRLKAADAALVPLVRRNIRAATADVPARSVSRRSRCCRTAAA